ncbi:MAG: OmpA family protein [Calditrichia bacterium]|nr:OmpA family protein [Calditrichia bacterium]
MKKILFAIVIFLLGLSTVFGQLSNIPGAFVDVGYGVRPMGMGGAFTAVSDDPNAAYWNPAGMLKAPHPGISLMYTKQMSIIPYYFTSFQMKLADTQALGASLMYNGDDLYNEFSFIGSYAYQLGHHFTKPFKKFYLGASVLYRYVGFGNNSDGGIGQVSGSANGYGFNFGMLWEITKSISVAAVWKDFGDGLQWSSQATDLDYSANYDEDIPSMLTFAAAIKPDKDMTIGIDYQKSIRLDTYDRIALGIEKEFFSFIIPRLGVSQNIFAPKDEQNQHLNVGLGIEPEFAESSIGVAFNFAYQFTDINPTLRFGIDLNWGIKHVKPIPPRGAFVLKPDTIKLGESTELKWLVRDATLIEIEPGIGRVDSAGSLILKPENSTTYKMTAIGPGGNLNYTAAINVIKFTWPPDIEFKFVPDTIKQGEKTELVWSVGGDVTELIIEGIGKVDTAGRLEFTPDPPSAFYILKAIGQGGEVAKVASVRVIPTAKEIKSKLVLEGIQFSSGSSTISAKSYMILDEVVASLIGYPEVKLTIQGYTDSVGKESNNLRLSQSRAESVMNYFVGKGIDYGRLKAVGFGELNPIASNNTKEGRAKNRRIELLRTD